MNVAPRILFVAQDAGGFNAVVPAYARLKRRYPKTVWGIFHRVAKPFSRGVRLHFVDATKLSRADLAKVFSRTKPDVLVVGTSAGLSIDKLATAIAREQGIPSVAVLDFWSNYALRFSDPGTFNLAYLSDHVCVMDEIARRGMMKEGIGARRIVVTGNPAFEKFARPLPSKKGSKVISFFSQPFSELKRAKMGIDYGYDEREVLRDVFEALAKIGRSEEMVVKHHPRTKDLTVFDALIRKSPYPARVDLRTPNDEILARSSVVIGMNTALLFEAALRGKRALSYQPNLKGSDALISNRLGLTTAVYVKSRLVPALKKLFATRPAAGIERARRYYVHGRATQNVLKVIRSLL